jgi:2-methylcitrate dehydratase PrpD
MSVLSRRLVLAAGTAAWFLPRASLAQVPVSPAMERLSVYMAEAGARALPEAAAERTKHAILDTLAAMISGTELPPGRIAMRFARSYGGAARSTVVASDIVAGPMEAALVNGLLAHSDETDDTHPNSFTHPGSASVAGALAAGEHFAISGERFLRAVALGYDVGTRIGAALGAYDYTFARHFSTLSVGGTFCSAAASACAAGLDARQMRWLLSYAAQQASGIYSFQRDPDHFEKGFALAGMPARNGVAAALLVQAGGTGVEDVFSGADNFFDAFRPLRDPALLTDKLGERYEVMRANIKKWTVGAPIQAPLNALETLIKKHGFAARDVKSLEVRLSPNEAAIVDGRDLADISIQHLMTVMLVDGRVTFASAHDAARVKDPVILRERTKIRLVPDPALAPLMPKRVAIVDVVLNDGRKLSERIEAVKGSAENPMTREEVKDKARDLIVPVLGAERFEKLSGAIFAVEAMANIVSLRPLLQKA